MRPILSHEGRNAPRLVHAPVPGGAANLDPPAATAPISDHRRLRPISTISSREKTDLSLQTPIGTVCNHHRPSPRRPSLPRTSCRLFTIVEDDRPVPARPPRSGDCPCSRHPGELAGAPDRHAPRRLRNRYRAARATVEPSRPSAVWIGI